MNTKLTNFLEDQFALLIKICGYPLKINIKTKWRHTATYDNSLLGPVVQSLISINSFSPNQLSTPNFSLHYAYKISHLVMRKCELIKQSKLLRIKDKILSNLFDKKCGLKLEELQIGLKRLTKG